MSGTGTRVFRRYLREPYPSVVRGEGLWLVTEDGRRLLDACSGGAMAACLGYGLTTVAEAWRRQGVELSYVYDEQFANPAREQLAEQLLSLLPEMGWVRFATGGSEANETALRLVRQYHVEQGHPERWKIVTPGQAYHGSTMGTLALTGRPRALHHPFQPYLASHAHLPPLSRDDTDGSVGLARLDHLLEELDPETVAAFFCEPISAAAYPAYSPPTKYWEGLAERRERYGFLICFDEVVTGLGRVGSWLAAHQLPLIPDVVTLGKGLGAGQVPISAMACRPNVYQAIADGSGVFDLGHTWDGAPLTCAAASAVLELIRAQGLVETVAERGPGLLERLRGALQPLGIVGEVRGRGFLLGFDLVSPRDSRSPLPAEIDAAGMVDERALDHGLLLTSTHASVDGMVSDQVLLAPAFVATDAELDQMIERLVATLAEVEAEVTKEIGRN
jgi:adenosylmethionine-8-amino-7-oxononanoate aminotransferase